MASLWRKTLLSIGFAGSLLALSLISRAGWPAPANILTVQRPLMGTVWKIAVVDHSRPEAARHAIEDAYKELERIDNLMSEWKPASPISQINAAAGQSGVVVPGELRELIQRSIAYGNQTQGTFDITWLGMGRIWHFDDSFIPPSPEEVAVARRNVDFRAIQIEGDRVTLPRAGMKIGLGGIAKGYAVDRASAILRRAGFTDSLVDGGGDVLASGTQQGLPWRLGVQEPRGERGQIVGTVSLSNMALVTSGDYERFRMVNGIRYHHIIDVRSGWPSGTSMAVTVLAPSAEQGVVLAKGIFILGPKKGIALARAEGVEALLIDPAGRRYMTPGFSTRLRTETGTYEEKSP